MNWWHYLLLVNIYLCLFYGFYTLLLRRETFFQLNRLYLVGSSILSFFIPLIQSDWVKDLFITKKVQYTIYGSNAISVTDIAPIKDNPVTVGEVLTVLYTVGVLCLFIRLIIQLVMLRKVINDPSPGVSYSFFSKIKVSEGIDGQEVIHNHELVHARQFHSADVLVIEAVMIINWFNPIVYLYRYAIKYVHEYIADKHTLDAGTNKADYALLLLSQTFEAPTHHLVNPFFNHSLLKKRIMMLHKNKSQRIKLIKYGLSAPLFILMMILSSATISDSKAVNIIHEKAEQAFEFTLHDTSYRSAVVSYDLKKDKLPASSDTIPDGKNQVFSAVEHAPAFPGGEAGFKAYLSENIKYPAEAVKSKVEGRSVLTFVVEEDGSLSDIKVVRSLGTGTDEEAIRVLKASPRWIPGKQNGHTVRVQYTVPVSFSLAKGSAQVAQPKNEPAYSAVQELPSFPGGMDAFSKYVSHSVKYPKSARNDNIQGRVIVGFIIEEDGALSNLKVIRGVRKDIDDEALRVMGASPKWTPGKQDGHAVRTQYTVPINFALAPDEDKNTRTGYVPANELKANPLVDTTSKPVRITLRESKGPEPLYVVDGKTVLKKSLNDINPNDIESITVLKDKPAIALYGKDGANGVVEVKTKKSNKTINRIFKQ
ncbi:TonB family protein [Mucilaginibacter litoreus]|uniref:TonB family protein n=1 Tax=Mucilaginibacter litoreus TaxID=1048221 RepID=A0ABW3APZ5_9SPHI